MTLPRPIILFLPVLVLAACSGEEDGQHPGRRHAEVPDDLARLLPQGAVLYAQVESLDRFQQLIDRFGEIVAPGQTSGDLTEILGPMAPFDASLVARDRPLGVAFTLSSSSPAPVATLLVPAEDPDALSASVRLGPGAAALRIAGRYVGIPMGPSYEADGSSRLLVDLPAGRLTVRADLGAVVQAYGPVIQASLNQVIELAKQSAVDPQMGGIDMERFFDLYADGARAVLASVDRLDFAVSLEGDRFSIQGVLASKADSPLAELASTEKVDLRPMAGLASGDSPMAFLMAGDMTELMDRFEPMLDSLWEIYPEPMRTNMQSYMDLYREAYALMGNSSMFDMSFHDGMSFLYYMKAKDENAALQLVGKLEEAMTSEAVKGMGIETEEPTVAEIQGREVVRIRTRFDWQKLMAAGGERDEVDGAAMAEMRRFMEMFYGEEGLSTSIAPVGDVVVMGVGADEADIAEALRRAASPGQPPAMLSRALDRVGQSTPGVVFSMDMAVLLTEMASMGSRAGMPEALLPPSLETRFPLVFYAALDGRLLRSGMELDMQQLNEFVRAAQRR